MPGVGKLGSFFSSSWCRLGDSFRLEKTYSQRNLDCMNPTKNGGLELDLGK